MKNCTDVRWITRMDAPDGVVSLFRRSFTLSGEVAAANLSITSLGVYEAMLGAQRVGDFIMAPGWTSYDKRLQYQTYDVKPLLSKENTLFVHVGPGWCAGRVGWAKQRGLWSAKTALAARLVVAYTDGRSEVITTDGSWEAAESPIRTSEIYDGEEYDACFVPVFSPAVIYAHGFDMLIPQEGEFVRETQRLPAVSILKTPAGECVVDFGQNLTGYVEFSLDAAPGDVVELSHAEVLDSSGNFYTDNLRSAKQKIRYTCRGGAQTYKPHLCFQGFRYIRLDTWPGEAALPSFTAVVVHTDMRRTGSFTCSDARLNRLFENIVWGQRGNYLDVPTDCPQRDERLGWTGDAQVFVRAAAYIYDVQTFFKKWLRDLAADQLETGGVPHVIPDVLRNGASSAAWGDAAVVCPWEVYLAYGNPDILKTQFESMQRWVDFIRTQGNDDFCWIGGEHFGDWLDLEGAPGEYAGRTDKDYIATAFFAHSTDLLIRAGHVLGRDMADYESLYKGIVQAFRTRFIKDGLPISDTQTACVLALAFGLVEDAAPVAKRLVQRIHESDDHLRTGFVGTPYLLHVLTAHGYAPLAYTLLLQDSFPSWLYSVSQGATTIWEHWDGIRPDGSMWSRDMNSFNHYAYGAVADWMFGTAAGINPDERRPGYAHIHFKPVTDERLDYVRASLETKCGTVRAAWERQADGTVTYRFTVPTGATATVHLHGQEYELTAGESVFG